MTTGIPGCSSSNWRLDVTISIITVAMVPCQSHIPFSLGFICISHLLSPLLCMSAHGAGYQTCILCVRVRIWACVWDRNFPICTVNLQYNRIFQSRCSLSLFCWLKQKLCWKWSLVPVIPLGRGAFWCQGGHFRTLQTCRFSKLRFVECRWWGHYLVCYH